MFKVGDKVKANEVYGSELLNGAEGVVISFWIDGPIVDFSKFMNDESFRSYYMLDKELDAID